ncbi:MAG: rhomboid family intramembrane serine protease [Deltaproteobacteria bacterium]|nr:rhomboid family intramembrane serine protease [Deltaproteobacteria bacterium]
MLPLRDQLPTRRRPVVTYALIALNVLAYLFESAAVSQDGHRIVVEWGLVPARFSRDPLAELPNVLSSMFLHAPDTWWHLGSNMLFLWIFGDNVEDALGRGRFVAFYLLSGLAAALAQVMIDPRSTVPMVGASGAIAGVLAAYGSLHPTSPITVLNPVPPLWLLFGPVFRLPAWLVILEFFAMNLLSGLGTLGRAGGGVAFFAHLGGFVAGVLLVRVFFDDEERKRRDALEAWTPPPRMHFERDDLRPAPGHRRYPRW